MNKEFDYAIFNINLFNEAQNAQYFLDFQDNHFTEHCKTQGIICVHIMRCLYSEKGQLSTHPQRLMCSYQITPGHFENQWSGLID